ncbi:STAS domain-containing protein [Amycolatopsis sp. WQ 127309]|uniref:STAS domain-containing protein n=1 Tax=Amycolatopsis sp. WQ 127309 TaxID=2932773 RepID=UPI001FF350D9|nr:STAS domain-containing protein [Amycolatopsis sp. WQ 127309]UOZ04917.1 STAS domain-containing protein [Amycolatopsis sp. WQ 127309]
MARSFTINNTDGRSLLDVTSRHPRPGAAVVTVRGDIDLVTAPRLADELNALCRTPLYLVLVDLSGVGFLSACGITVLLTLERHCREASIELTLVSSPAVRRVLERLDLTELFGMTEVVRLIPAQHSRS